jgi:hypothetical protein
LNAALVLIKLHAIKMQKFLFVKVLVFFNLELDREENPASYQLLYLWVKSIRDHCEGGWMGPQQVWVRKKNFWF